MSNEERNFVEGLYLLPVLNKLNQDLIQEFNLQLGFFVLVRKDDFSHFNTQIIQKEEIKKENHLPKERFFRYIDSNINKP